MSTIADKIKSLSNIKIAIKNKLTTLGLNPTDKFTSYANLISSINKSLSHLFHCETTDEASAIPSSISISSNYDSSGLVDMSYFLYMGDNVGESCPLTSMTFPSNFSTSSLSSVQNAFHGCTNLTTLQLPPKFITSVCHDASRVFVNCKSLTSIDASDWDMSNIVSTVYMFDGCTSLTTITGIENWNMSKGYNVSAMFRGCNNLVFPDLLSWSMVNVSSIDSVFQACKKMTMFRNESIMHPTAMGGAFAYDDNLEEVNIPNLSTDAIKYSPWGFFYQCFKLHTIILGEAFGRASKPITLDLSQTGTKATDDTVIGTAYSAYTFSDTTWNSFLNLHDRTDYTDTFTIQFSTNHKTNYANWDSFVEYMTARGYNITTA